MSVVPLDKLVVVHPHVEFDGDQKCKPYLDRTIDDFQGQDSDILVLQGFKEEDKELTDERLELYLESERGYKLTDSKKGEIDESLLEGFIQDGSVIELPGGIVGQCHRAAFKSIIKYVQDNDIHDVELKIPFDGCYFQHGFTYSDSIDIHTFDGVFMGGYAFEMEGGDSYTLREVATKVFGELEGPNNLHRRQLRDQPATPETIRNNLLQHFFDGYFTMPHGEKIVTREYSVDVTDEHMRIHID